MNTATIDGQRVEIQFKTHTSMSTRLTSPTGKTSLYGANIYETSDKAYKILIPTSGHNGSEIDRFRTILTADEYSQLADLYDPYNEGAFHLAVMNRIGFV